ncbi:Uncharacterized protein TCM_044420 [Theobroma cacao]|uniref:Uncharacterized protein n=1 Tax=Theobroma cacao TaxID=3641 RepID=A0A061FRQ4_THECC|nr:Uncharacterized protein TCM_044420 [Theobroma cacao]
MLPGSLTSLDIFDFPKLEILPSNGFQNLTSLETLCVGSCPNLRSLPEKDMLSSLLRLEIWGCEVLKEQCKKDKGPEWSNIEHIPYVQIHGSISMILDGPDSGDGSGSDDYDSKEKDQSFRLTRIICHVEICVVAVFPANLILSFLDGISDTAVATIKTNTQAFALPFCPKSSYLLELYFVVNPCRSSKLSITHVLLKTFRWFFILMNGLDTFSETEYISIVASIL